MAARFKSGLWLGTYNQGAKKNKVSFNARFESDGKVEGEGFAKEAGVFSVTGKVELKPPYAGELVFTFSSGQKITLNGWREGHKGGLFGTWAGLGGSGNFSVEPAADDEIADAFDLMKEATKETVAKLEAMGFPKELCEQAVEVSHGSLENAVEYITHRLTEDTIPPSTQGGIGRESSNDSEPVDPEVLKQLIDFGFSSDIAAMALRQSNGDLNQALDWLTN